MNTHSIMVWKTLFLMMIVYANGLSLSSENASSEEELELLRSKEIKRMKSRFMSQLGVSELPHVTNLPPMKVPEMAFKIMLEEEPTPVLREEHEAKLLILPSNSNFSCKYDNSSFCQRFEFNIVNDAMLSTAELWFREVNSSSPTDVAPSYSVLCKHRWEEHEQMVEEGNMTAIVQHQDFSALNLNGLAQLDQRIQGLQCSVEVTGVAISEERDSLPFFRAVQAEHARRRRSTRNTSSQESCQVIPFEVSFETDIGWMGVIEPKKFQANLCRGECMEAETLHEVAVDFAFTQNTALKEEYGMCWSTCCKPKTYRGLRVLHTENRTGLILNEVFTNMVVESCSCG